MEDQTSAPRGIAYILPTGETVPVSDIDRMLAVFGAGARSRAEVLSLLRACARECQEGGETFDAVYALERALAIAATAEENATVLLLMGQILEDAGDYQCAANAYARAFALPPGTDATWYLLLNNLGYCLNILGRHAEAEALCRSAVEIDPARHNAFKNLGVSLQGLGRLEEAAECYRRAAKLCPEDGRAQRLLDQLQAERQD